MENPSANLPVSMTRHNLDHLPNYPIFTPYKLRWFQPGDQKYWIDIHLEADKFSKISMETYEASFGTDENKLAQRQA